MPNKSGTAEVTSSLRLSEKLKDWQSQRVGKKLTTKKSPKLLERVATALLELQPTEGRATAKQKDLKTLLGCWLHMKNRLSDGDPVYKCICSISRKFKKRGTRSFLVNGKIEMALKVFLGTAWEESREGRAYVMDKTFKKKVKARVGGIDFLALNREGNETKPAFWIETKCSMLEDRANGTRCAHSALRQVNKAVKTLIPELQSTTAYIVHFFASMPQTYDAVWNLYPHYVQERYTCYKWAETFSEKSPVLRKKRRDVELKRLHGIYINTQGKRSYLSSRIMTVCEDPFVAAIVVRLK